MSNKYRDKNHGCLVDGMAGDALGYAIKLNKLKEIRKTNHGYQTIKLQGK